MLMDSSIKLARFAQSNKHVQESLEIVEKAFSRYLLVDTCISFNGGKDCTAVLHLVSSVVRNLNLNRNNNSQKILAFYAQVPDHFEEESTFVQETVKRYSLNLVQYSNHSLKDSLFQLKTDSPEIKAIFVGTRRDDLKPGSQLDFFTPTDKDWPSFMRVNPILHWSYDQVWKFIRELDIPYCDLYNQGYSSLGTRKDTQKNSNLLRFDPVGKPYYLAAWNLNRPQEERISRSSSIDTTNKTLQQ